MQSFFVLLKIDGDYKWFITTAKSSAEAKSNAQFIAAKITYPEINSVSQMVKKLKDEHDFAISINDEIDRKLWKKSTPLRGDGARPTLPEITSITDKVTQFMRRFYGDDVISYPVDMLKLRKNAITFGFTGDEIGDHEFIAAVDAYIYDHLK